MIRRYVDRFGWGISGVFVFLAVVVGWGWHCPRAAAYVLPSPHVLELMAGKAGKLRSLKVVQQVEIFRAGEGKGSTGVVETALYQFPNRFRADIDSENLRRIYVFSDGNELTVLDGVISPGSSTWFDCYKDILLCRSRRQLQNRLIRWGVDLGVASFGRFEGQIAFVLGAEYPDESVPQLWVDKETFRPIRWIVSKNRPELPEEYLEIRFLEWKQITGVWYPKHIEFRRDRQLLREIHAQEIEVDPVLTSDLFDIGHIRSAHRMAPEPETERLPDERQEMGEVQKAIEDFRRRYE